jgi:hypothetical protein
MGGGRDGEPVVGSGGSSIIDGNGMGCAGEGMKFRLGVPEALDGGETWRELMQGGLLFLVRLHFCPPLSLSALPSIRVCFSSSAGGGLEGEIFSSKMIS